MKSIYSLIKLVAKSTAIVVALILVSPLILLAILIMNFSDFIQKRQKQSCEREFRRKYVSVGKFVLFIYSNSPNWQTYIEENILSKIEKYSIVLNWSQRKTWRDICAVGVEAHRIWGGDNEHNPIAIVFLPQNQVRVIRFWKAFRDFKHGNTEKLKSAE